MPLVTQSYQTLLPELFYRVDLHTKGFTQDDTDTTSLDPLRYALQLSACHERDEIKATNEKKILIIFSPLIASETVEKQEALLLMFIKLLQEGFVIFYFIDNKLVPFNNGKKYFHCLELMQVSQISKEPHKEIIRAGQQTGLSVGRLSTKNTYILDHKNLKYIAKVMQIPSWDSDSEYSFDIKQFDASLHKSYFDSVFGDTEELIILVDEDSFFFSDLKRFPNAKYHLKIDPGVFVRNLKVLCKHENISEEQYIQKLAERLHTLTFNCSDKTQVEWLKRLVEPARELRVLICCNLPKRSGTDSADEVVGAIIALSTDDTLKALNTLVIESGICIDQVMLTILPKLPSLQKIRVVGMDDYTLDTKKIVPHHKLHTLIIEASFKSFLTKLDFQKCLPNLRVLSVKCLDEIGIDPERKAKLVSPRNLVFPRNLEKLVVKNCIETNEQIRQLAKELSQLTVLDLDLYYTNQPRGEIDLSPLTRLKRCTIKANRCVAVKLPLAIQELVYNENISLGDDCSAIVDLKKLHMVYVFNNVDVAEEASHWGDLIKRNQSLIDLSIEPIYEGNDSSVICPKISCFNINLPYLHRLALKNIQVSPCDLGILLQTNPRCFVVELESRLLDGDISAISMISAKPLFLRITKVDDGDKQVTAAKQALHNLIERLPGLIRLQIDSKLKYAGELSQPARHCELQYVQKELSPAAIGDLLNLAEKPKRLLPEFKIKRVDNSRKSVFYSPILFEKTYIDCDDLTMQGLCALHQRLPGIQQLALKNFQCTGGDQQAVSPERFLHFKYLHTLQVGLASGSQKEALRMLFTAMPSLKVLHLSKGFDISLLLESRNERDGIIYQKLQQIRTLSIKKIDKSMVIQLLQITQLDEFIIDKTSPGKGLTESALVDLIDNFDSYTKKQTTRLSVSLWQSLHRCYDSLRQRHQDDGYSLNNRYIVPLGVKPTLRAKKIFSPIDGAPEIKVNEYPLQI